MFNNTDIARIAFRLKNRVQHICTGNPREGTHSSLMDEYRQAGFSMTELLATTLIMGMVTAITAAGIPTVKSVYERVVLTSNAEVMLSTTTTLIKQELGTAWDVALDSHEILYTSAQTGAKARLRYNEEKKTIEKLDYAAPVLPGLIDPALNGVGAEEEWEPLIPETGGLHPEWEDVQIEGGTITISGLKICSDKKVIARSGNQEDGRLTVHSMDHAEGENNESGT